MLAGNNDCFLFCTVVESGKSSVFLIDATVVTSNNPFYFDVLLLYCGYTVGYPAT